MFAKNLAGALEYRDGLLHIEEMPVTQLAKRYGTPLYVYSTATLRGQYRALQDNLGALASSVLICYALKANSNVVLGGLLASWGAGADVVSGGELYLAQHMGFPGEKIVFAGVGKTRREMAEALGVGILSFHVESAGELEVLAEVAAQAGKVAPVAVRVNPDVDAHTHPYITTGTKANKFGVNPEQALSLIRRSAHNAHLSPVGLHVHIGSQLATVTPIVDATRRVLQLWDMLAQEDVHLRELDIGGGLGIAYRPEDNPEGPEALAAGLRPLLEGRDLELVLEPGRFLVGSAGALLTTVIHLKDGLAVVAAGMTDLLRPALYGAWHPVWPIHAEDLGTGDAVDVVGPVCESADVLAKDRRLGALRPGDILAIGQAGAYSFSMSSQYNGRPRPAEVLVDGGHATIIRPRETYEDLL